TITIIERLRRLTVNPECGFAKVCNPYKVDCLARPRLRYFSLSSKPKCAPQWSKLFSQLYRAIGKFLCIFVAYASGCFRNKQLLNRASLGIDLSLEDINQLCKPFTSAFYMVLH